MTVDEAIAELRWQARRDGSAIQHLARVTEALSRRADAITLRLDACSSRVDTLVADVASLRSRVAEIEVALSTPAASSPRARALRELAVVAEELRYSAGESMSAEAMASQMRASKIERAIEVLEAP